MTTNSRKSIGTQLNSISLLIHNSRSHDQIRTIMGGFGYTETRMQQGEALYDAAMNAVREQQHYTGALHTANEQADLQRKRAMQAYQSLAKICRAIYPPNAPELTELGLIGAMPQRDADFIHAALVLFHNAQTIAPIAMELANYSYDAAKLTSERAIITAYNEANQSQVAAQAASKNATARQREARAAVQEWAACYTKIARVALKEYPALLDHLGIKVPDMQAIARRSAVNRTSTGDTI